MAKLVYSADSEAACQIEAKRLAEELRALADAPGLADQIEVLGPAPWFMHKLRGRYRWQVLLRGADLAPAAGPPDPAARLDAGCRPGEHALGAESRPNVV